MSSKEKNLERFRKILNVYNEIKLDKMAKLIGFKNSINLEQWILDLPEKYHSNLTIKGKDVIINKANISGMIDELLKEFESWDSRKSGKILEKIDFGRKFDIAKRKTIKSADSMGEIKLTAAGEKFLNLLSTHKSISVNNFIKVFELEELADIDDWLLNLPKKLGVFLNVRNNVLSFESKTPHSIKLKLSQDFDDWITKLMNNLTRIDESAVNREISRFPRILGKGFHNFFKIDIRKKKEKYLILHIKGKNQFVSKSKYGDRTYTAFTVDKEVKERVSDFLPNIIEKKKKESVQWEIQRRNGKKFYYVSPAGRHISRTINTKESDFNIKLKHLLIIVNPVNTICFSILRPSAKQDIRYVNVPNKMCVKCGNIFKSVDWLGWDIKYLTTNNVYICEDCYPKLKNIIKKERTARSIYELDLKQVKSKKSKIKTLSIINLILLLVIGLPLISIFIPLIIFSVLEVYLLRNWIIISKKIHNMERAESNRRNIVLNSIKRYDGDLLKKNYIPDFCRRCRWFNENDLKCHVDEEAGEIYDDFNLNGEKVCFEPRNN